MWCRRGGAGALATAVAVALMGVASPAFAAGGTTTRVSVASDGTEANSGSARMDISADGRYVAFESVASNLVPGDNNGQYDVFVHDRLAGDTTRVSVGPAGVEGQGISWLPSISGDGRYVAFSSSASNLVPGDTNDAYDVFVHDMQSGETTRASVQADGTQLVGSSHSPVINADGTVVAFAVAGESGGVSVKDRTTGQLEFVGSGSNPAISGDGRVVAYVDSSLATPGDTNNAADVMTYDGDTGVTSRVSVTSGGGQANGSSYYPSLSGNGRYVSFASEATNLVPGDTNGAFDVFVHDRVTVQTERVSTRSGGQQSDDVSFWPALSADGRYVAFHSGATNLVPGDSNGQWDVFVHDRVAGTTSLESRSSNGLGNGHSELPTLSDDGRVVAFYSQASNLVDDDSNNFVDVFVRERGPVDTTAPGVSLDEVPALVSDDNTPTFGFGSEEGAVFECSLSTGEDAYSDCSSPLTYAPQPDGTYTFKVRATDTSGNTGEPDTATFTIDTAAPGTPTITDAPAALSTSSSAEFSFSGGAANTFECSLSTGANDYVPCTSPQSYASVDDGDYVFKVRATNPAGSVGEAATHAFTIDTVGPLVSLEGGPAAVTGDNTPTFPFSAEPGTTFECSLSSGADAFEPCTSPVTFAAQPDGPVTFKVLGTDTAGNVGPLTQYTFTIDATPASVDIISGPSGVTSSNTATFEFASENGVSFECSLSDGANAFEPCESPVTYPGLADGDYLFKVRGTDGAGNLSAAATAAFTIDTTAPTVVLDSTPAPSSTQASATFEFSSEAGAAFECSLTPGAGSYQPCESPATFQGLAPDDYVFGVRATDPAGNRGAPVTFAFTVEPDDVDVPAPSTPDLTAASDTGLSSSDNVTSDTTPTFTGTAPVGTTVGILVDGVLRGTAAVPAAGTYTVTSAAIPTGSRTVAAIATDSAGHTSPTSGTLSVDIVEATACHTATNQLNGTAANNTLTGTRLADLIFGLGGNDVLNGRANNDCLVGGTGNDTIKGAVGNDELVGDDGDDNLQGAVGNDHLVGGDGNDKLALGAGTDVATGGEGKDRIFARDGEFDRIDCGGGTADIANVDNLDITVNCETVRVR